MATATKREVSHAELIRVLVEHAPPLPDEQCEQIRKLIKRESANDSRPNHPPGPRPTPTGPQGPGSPTPPPPPKVAAS